MKNLLKGISLLIILAGLFSCQTASIMKRHYNKGYYVSKKHKAPDTNGSTAVTHEKAPARESISVDKLSAEPDNASVSRNQSVPEKVNEATPSKRSKKINNLFKDETTTGSSFAPSNIMNHPFNVRKNLKEAIAKDDVARDALSLLWILILVLLIVYVIGLIFDLFGLGPVFHVLGVIVLVLLILWLLRII
jgi:hypothetical protein